MVLLADVPSRISIISALRGEELFVPLLAYLGSKHLTQPDGKSLCSSSISLNSSFKSIPVPSLEVLLISDILVGERCIGFLPADAD